MDATGTGAVLAELGARLACPWCDAVGLAYAGDADGQAGSLACASCGRASAVEAGIWRAMGPRSVPKTAAQLSNLLPATAHVYERLWRGRSLSFLSGRSLPVEEELGDLEAFVEPGPGQLIVDVACSEGLYARRLARSGAVVLAVDHALPFVRAARRRAAADGVRVVPVQASAQHLPVATGAADAVVMGGSLNEIGDRSGAAAEMARVTRLAGRAYSMSLTAATTGRGRLLQAIVRPSGIVFPTVEETETLFASHGLAVVSRARDRVVLRLGMVREAPAGPRLP